MNRLLFAIAMLGLLSTSAHATETPYPEWSLTDSRGQQVNYPADINKPTLILYWASWCPYCKALMPHLQSVIDEYGSSTVDVWAVNVFEKDGADPKAHLEDRAFEFKLLTNGERVAKSWGVHATPGLFLTDNSGKITWHLGMTQQMRGDDGARVKHWQIAARKAPFWAAELRKALDEVLAP